LHLCISFEIKLSIKNVATSVIKCSTYLPTLKKKVTANIELREISIASHFNTKTMFVCIPGTDSKNMDDPPMAQSPMEAMVDRSPEPPNPRTSPPIETYNINSVNATMKILSKGSKKWIGDQPLQPLKPDIYQIDTTDCRKTT
jgi:hypothetical protein